MNVYVARQPIFNKNKKIYAYELLFRTGSSNAFPDIDGDTATKSLLSSSFFTVGIERIAGKKKSFINFTEELLLKNIPEMFPQEKIMIEILEDIEPTPEIVDVCRNLKKKGYELALDDFVYERKFEPLIELCDLIKIDFLLTPVDEVREMVKKFSTHKCKLLAEKIETYEEFQRAVDMGFSYFQGYFFSKPEILENKDISSNKLNILQLVHQINKKDIDFDEIEKLINQDVSISYKLIKYLNSSYFSRLQPLSSIRQAIAFLGEREIRQFISLISVGNLGEDKPHELIRTSVIRARFLETVGKDLRLNSNELFMLGLFSLIDAMLDRSMEYLLEKMPLSQEVCDALGQRKGHLIPYLQLVEYYEGGEWESFETILSRINLSPERVVEIYLDSVGWANNF